MDATRDAGCSEPIRPLVPEGRAFRARPVFHLFLLLTLFSPVSKAHITILLGSNYTLRCNSEKIYITSATRSAVT